MESVGGRPDSLATAARRAGDIAAYVELHIEQGKVLESEGVDIGMGTAQSAESRQPLAGEVGFTSQNPRRRPLTSIILKSERAK